MLKNMSSYLNLLSDIWFANIFSRFVGFFHFAESLLSEVFSLMLSHLFIFLFCCLRAELLKNRYHM